MSNWKINLLKVGKINEKLKEYEGNKVRWVEEKLFLGDGHFVYEGKVFLGASLELVFFVFHGDVGVLEGV